MPTAVAALTLLSGGAWAGPATASPAKLTFVQGKVEAQNEEGKAWRPAKRGDALGEAGSLRTAERSRAELTLADGSRVRLGPKGRLTLTHGRLSAKARRKVSVRLWVGRLWANVVRAVGGPFEVVTDNAVGGVRGTSFAVFAAADASAIVRVYAGSVGVRPALGETPTRKRVPGPRRIDVKQWKEIIATAMKQVRISQLGEISAAEDFEATPDEQQWANWNRGRDSKR